MENDGSDIAIEGDLFWPSRPELEVPGFVLRKAAIVAEVNASKQATTVRDEEVI